MLYKKHMNKNNIAYLTYLSFKSIKTVFLFSLLILFVLVPILNFGNYKLFGLSDELLITVIHTARRLIPFSSIIPTVMIMRVFLETDCSEILSVYFKGRRLVIAYLSNAAIVVLSSALFLVYGHYFDNIPIEYLKVVSASFMLFGLSYFLMSLTHSTAISTLILVIYEIFLVVSVEITPINFALFSKSQYDCLFSWMLMIAIGILLSVAGETINKLKLTY